MKNILQALDALELEVRFAYIRVETLQVYDRAPAPVLFGHHKHLAVKNLVNKDLLVLSPGSCPVRSVPDSLSG